MKKVVYLAALLSVFIYGISLAASANPTVTVGNTSANPVPVKGDVGITGTPNVKVANTVSVTGDVKVIDSATRAEQYQCQNTCDTDSYICSCKITGFPANKRLVIETVSLRVAVPTGETPPTAQITTNVNGFSAGFVIPLTYSNSYFNPGGYDTYITLLNTRLYADNVGYPPDFLIVRNSYTPPCSLNVSVSGYLVDIP